MKVFNKLVRDRILEIIEQDGEKPVSRILELAEYRQELAKKAVEEAYEIVAAGDNKEELLKEIADVLEVLDALIVSYDLDKTQLQQIKEQRKAKRGGFEKRIFLQSSE